MSENDDPLVTVTTEQLEQALALARRNYTAVVRLSVENQRKVGPLLVGLYGGDGKWAWIGEIGLNGARIT